MYSTIYTNSNIEITIAEHHERGGYFIFVCDCRYGAFDNTIVAESQRWWRVENIETVADAIAAAPDLHNRYLAHLEKVNRAAAELQSHIDDCKGEALANYFSRRAERQHYTCLVCFSEACDAPVCEYCIESLEKAHICPLCGGDGEYETWDWANPEQGFMERCECLDVDIQVEFAEHDCAYNRAVNLEDHGFESEAEFLKSLIP